MSTMTAKVQTPSTSQEMTQFIRHPVFSDTFETTSRYMGLNPIGIGDSGQVCSANDRIAGGQVAVKKLANPFKTDTFAKHTFREVKLLKHLQHENIILLKDIFISPSEDVYLVTDLMATDLTTISKSRRLDDEFAQYFLYQIMRGLTFFHSAGVIHRDLKPSNILVNENCDVKLCNFGLARVQNPEMTGYVSTRYYRAPEIMLTWKHYDEKVDVWSVGCIFAEMLLGSPLSAGKNHIDQFHVITKVLGSPPDIVIANVTSQNTLNFLLSPPKIAAKPLHTLFPAANPQAVALMDKMLRIDPGSRCSSIDALASPYLAPYHDPTDEPTATAPVDLTLLEANCSADTYKTIIYWEIFDYHERMNSHEPLL